MLDNYQFYQIAMIVIFHHVNSLLVAVYLQFVSEIFFLNHYIALLARKQTAISNEASAAEEQAQTIALYVFQVNFLESW